MNPTMRVPADGIAMPLEGEPAGAIERSRTSARGPDTVLETVLVVDDDPIVRRTVADLLGRRGFPTLTAADADAALAHLAAQSDIGLAVIDVLMAGVDGPALLRRIQERAPRTAVVMLTAVHDLATAIDCLTHGADQFLLKPVRVPDLHAAIDKALGRRRLALENERYRRHLERMVEERTLDLARANDRLRELDRLKSEFVSRVSHELRSPLTVMHTNLAVLVDGLTGPLTEEQLALLVSCQRSIRRLSRLVENVLEFSRLESSRTELVCAPLAPGGLATAVVGDYARSAAEASIDLVVTDDCPDDLRIVGDRDKLEQVLGNLVDNALKFTPAGGRVGVRVGPAGDGVTFTVSDTGPGVPSVERAAIFERFVQGTPPANRRRRGSGLGLTIARSLVELHGGTLTLGEAQTSGGRFEVWLPLVALAPIAGRASELRAR